VDGGAGGDRIHSALAGGIGELDANFALGAGNDWLQAAFGPPPAAGPEPAVENDVTTIMQKVREAVDGGAGNDEVALSHRGRFDDLAQMVHLGDGQDQLTSALDGIFGNLHLLADLGRGHDRGEINHVGPVSGAASIRMLGGQGNDRLSAVLAPSPAASPPEVLVELLGEDGNDALSLLVRGGVDPALLMALADGGDGFDTGIFSAGVRHINVERVTEL
jgi:hypothetical protein